MTILIPYKPDLHEGEELRFALRSIDKYLTGFTNLIIIGQPPEWYNGIYMKVQDYPDRKQFTIYNKLLLATNREDVADNFILWNDDHFLLRHIDVTDIKYWYEGMLADTNSKTYGVRYYQAIQNTLRIIPNTFNFDIHVPIIFNKAKFRAMFSNKTTEICIKSYYCTVSGVNGEPMTDLKINQLFSEDAIRELLKGRIFFSTGSNGIRIPMMKVFNELYPDKSQWEK